MWTTADKVGIAVAAGAFGFVGYEIYKNSVQRKYSVLSPYTHQKYYASTYEGAVNLAHGYNQVVNGKPTFIGGNYVNGVFVKDGLTYVWGSGNPAHVTA